MNSEYPIRLAAMAIVAAIASESVHAASYSWGQPGGGTFQWPTTTQNNWGTGIGGAFPSAAGDIANIDNGISANLAIDLMQSITIGTLNMGDTDGVSSTTINSGTGTNTLTFQSAVAGGGAFLNVNGIGSAGNTINSGIAVGGTSSLTIGTPGTPRLTTGGVLATNGNSVIVTGGASATPTWTVVGDITGNGTVTVNSAGGVAVSGAKSFTGTFVLNRGVAGSSNTGSLVVTSGSIANAVEVVINGALSNGVSQAGGNLHAGNSSDASTNPGQRLTSNKITLNSGTLEANGQDALIGTANDWQKGLEIVQDNVNILRFNSGFSTVSTSKGGDNPGTLVNITTVQRGAGATAYVRSTTLGAASKIVAGNGASLLVGAGGAPGSTTMSIIPWMGANNSSSGTSNPGGFGTHIAGVGFRALETAEYSTSLTAGSTANIRVGGIGLASDVSVNSLVFTNGGAQNFGAGQTMTVVSGGVFITTNGGAIGGAGSATAGTLNLGTSEGVIWSTATNVNTVGAVITGSAGLSKAGTGTLILAGANTYTGVTHVSGGTLRVGNGTNASVLGDDDVFVHNGATLDIQSADVIDDDEALILRADGLFNGIVNVGTGLIEVVNTLQLGTSTMPAGYYGSSAAFTANPSLQGEITVYNTYFTGAGLVQVVPEPTTLSLLGLVGLTMGRRRR